MQTSSLKWLALMAISVCFMVMALGSLSTAFANGGRGKVTICHVTRNGRVIPIRVSRQAARRHLNHGDFRPIEFFADMDGDGLGDPGNSKKRCKAPNGFVENADDCDDTDAGIGGPEALFADADGDGFGYPNTAQTACPANGLVDDNTDCDDTNAAVNPGATEIEGNGLDDDCDPSTPDEPQVQCPCAGVTHEGVTWGDALPTTACIQLPNSLLLRGNPITSGLETSPGSGFCNIYPLPGSNDVFQLPTTAEEGAACTASLVQIAANDGITCP